MHPERLNFTSIYYIFGNEYKYAGSQIDNRGSLVYYFMALHPKYQPAVVPYKKEISADQLRRDVSVVRD